jgi:methyl coenzyme M reductase beta subunit
MTDGNDLMTDQNTDTTQLNCGLTKREYFAAMAMQGLLANNFMIDVINEHSNEWIAQSSVSIADALIQELNKTNYDNNNNK